MTTRKKAARKAGTTAKTAHPWLGSYPDGIDWNIPIEPIPLTRLIEEAVAEFGERPCTYFLGRSLSYAEIGARADRVAAGLQRNGIGKGERVGLMLPNCAAFLQFYFGVLKAGAVVVNLNPLYSAEELARVVRDARCSLVVTLDLDVLFEKLETLVVDGIVNRAVVCSFAAELPWLKALAFNLFQRGRKGDLARSPARHALVSHEDLIRGAGTPAPVEIDPQEDVAVLQYTGGTTGVPKGAMLTHANLSANLQQVQAWFNVAESGKEKVLAVLPFFHVFAMTTIMNLGLRLGAELLLMPRFRTDDALKLIRKRRPSILPGVPTLFNAFLHEPGVKPEHLASLKYCISGGAPLPHEVKLAFEKLATCTLVEGYGLSETSPVATCNPLRGAVKPGSIGIPLPGTRLSVRSLDDREQELGPGEDGEICIAGPQVMKGYWNDPEATAEVFVGDFLRTGDVGHMDEDGFFFIVDRLKDIINCSGYKVYPRNVEEAIYQFPAVEEVTVVGIPDDYRGEAPKAFIKLKGGHQASEEDIVAFLKDKLSPMEIPDEIEFRDELPRTLVGKLSKKELREESAGSGAEN